MSTPHDRPTQRRVLTGLIGAGIGPSLSPALHEHEAARARPGCTYTRFDLDDLGLPPDAVGDLLARTRAEGRAGVNVTHPCKQLVIAHLDELSPDAAAIGAVNTVVFDGGRAIGHNTDWSGFRDGSRRAGCRARRSAGSCCSARAAPARPRHTPCSTWASRRCTVLDVDAQRARALADVRSPGTGPGGPAGAPAAELDAAARRTRTGWCTPPRSGWPRTPALPLPVALLRRRAVGRRDRLPPARDRAAAGGPGAGAAAPLDGGRMAVHQAAEAFRLFTGVDPDPARMLRHLAELVRAESTGGVRARWRYRPCRVRRRASHRHRHRVPVRHAGGQARRPPRRPGSTASRSSSPTSSRRRCRRPRCGCAAPTWACRSTSTSRSATSTRPIPSASRRTCAAPSTSSR